MQTIFPILVMQCYPSAYFHQQPPTVELLLLVAFNYNYGTFMPHHPKVRPSQGEFIPKESMSTIPSSSNNEPRHHVRVVFKEDTTSARLVYNVDRDKVTLLAQDLGLKKPTEYNHVEFLKLCQQCDSSSLYSPMSPSNGPILKSNLLKQFDFLQEYRDATGQVAWNRFVLNSYRLNERRNLRKSHVLFVHFLFDFPLGKIGKLTRYEMLPMDQAKEKVPKAGHREYLQLDDPTSVPTVLVEEFGRDLYGISSCAGDPPSTFQYWPAKQSEDVASYYFDILEKLPFPVLAGPQCPQI
eukprot:CAMPEP_0198141822 /NCGR_PEP_ID=MMETSP1443-20131203/4759_1 /TAXON_ID=186043 /ORGANISM="Entomoneis sp., Strain CCMP2396" /LENGTH=295 /DNA_ID=CAMNT_0043804681 /DNA_START=364 /DNA_END=1251 /DNA_ORIENTATION=-